MGRLERRLGSTRYPENGKEAWNEREERKTVQTKRRCEVKEEQNGQDVRGKENDQLRSQWRRCSLSG